MSENNRFQKIINIKDGLNRNGADKDEKDIRFDKDFYSDLDKIRRKNCCSLPTIIFFLVLTFVLIIYGLVYLKNYTKVGISYLAENKGQNQVDLTNSFIEQTSGLVSGQTATLEFTEVEIAKYLGIWDSDFPLKDSKLSIDNQGIHVSGKMSQSFFSLTLRALLQAKIENGKLIFFLDDIATGSISMPNRIKAELNDYLDLIMRSKNLYDPNLEIISVATRDKTFELVVYKK